MSLDLNGVAKNHTDLMCAEWDDWSQTRVALPTKDALMRGSRTRCILAVRYLHECNSFTKPTSRIVEEGDLKNDLTAKPISKAEISGYIKGVILAPNEDLEKIFLQFKQRIIDALSRSELPYQIDNTFLIGSLSPLRHEPFAQLIDEELVDAIFKSYRSANVGIDIIRKYNKFDPQLRILIKSYMNPYNLEDILQAAQAKNPKGIQTTPIEVWEYDATLRDAMHAHQADEPATLTA